MKKKQEKRTLERILAREISNDEMEPISAGDSTGGTFTRSGDPEAWDDCKDEDSGGGGFNPENP